MECQVWPRFHELQVFTQHGPEAMMAIAFTNCPSIIDVSVGVVNNSRIVEIVEVFDTIIATGLKSYRHV